LPSLAKQRDYAAQANSEKASGGGDERVHKVVHRPSHLDSMAELSLSQPTDKARSQFLAQVETQTPTTLQVKFSGGFC
jgi:hypothetical protein